jgi:hypothetical protein
MERLEKRKKRFDPSIRRHSGIEEAADEEVLNTVCKKIKNPPKKYVKKYVDGSHQGDPHG